jgi:hypothetical protein
MSMAGSMRCLGKDFRRVGMRELLWRGMYIWIRGWGLGVGGMCTLESLHIGICEGVTKGNDLEHVMEGYVAM